MVFEGRFVYPFAHTMYDPVLKVRVCIHDVREAGPEDLQIAIYYDPAIEADRLTLPVSEEVKAFWRSRPHDKHKADDDSIRRPFKSDKDIKVYEQPCYWERSGEVVRLKIPKMGDSFIQARRLIKSINIDHISDLPLQFLLYVYKNFINLSALEDDYYSRRICPDARRVEFCLNADAFLNAFELSPADYAEVEAGWYCLASKELAR